MRTILIFIVLVCKQEPNLTPDARIILDQEPVLFPPVDLRGVLSDAFK